VAIFPSLLRIQHAGECRMFQSMVGSGEQLPLVPATPKSKGGPEDAIPKRICGFCSDFRKRTSGFGYDCDIPFRGQERYGALDWLRRRI
jgi:hypothetical protein